MTRRYVATGLMAGMLAAATAVSTKAASTQAGSTQAAPTQAAPMQVASTQAAPMQVASMQVASTDTAPTQAAPVQSAPTRSAPTRSAPTQAAQAPARPSTDVFVAPLSIAGRTLTVGKPVNISDNPGYDNQPSFLPDGSAVLFTSVRDGATQSEIYRYALGGAGTLTRLTDTAESEYSPTVTPDGRHFSVIRVEADGTQRLWQFTLEGREPSLVLTDVKPVGYHAWTDATTLALFVLGKPATLQVADRASGAATIVARDIGRSIQVIPGRGTVSFVARETAPSASAAAAAAPTAAAAAAGSGAARTGTTNATATTAAATSNAAVTLWVRELDPKTRVVTPLVKVMPGVTEADCAWTPDGLLLMAHDGALYGWRRGEADWTRMADLDALGLAGVSRMAVSPKGDRIAFVATAKP